MVQRWQRAGADVRVVAPLPHYPTGRREPGHGGVYRQHTGEHGEAVVHVPFLPTRRGGALKFADQVLAGFASLPPSLTGTRPHVVLVSLPALPSLLPALLARRRWRAPLVLEMRDAWPDLLAESGVARGRSARWLARQVTAAQRRADAVVTVTRDFGAVLAERGVDPARLHWMPNGIDLDLVPALPPPDTRAPRPLRVLYLGTHGVSQQLDTVVEALAAAGAERVEARFIGHGTEKARLEALSRQRGAPICFEPPATGPALWDAYAWADTCLVPLRPWPAFRHTVPSKLYEVLAAGRHVTAGVEGEAARIVAAARGGTVVPPGDAEALAEALRRLSSDRSACDVGDTPRHWVEENASYDSIATRYLDLLRRVARLPATSAP
jgi:glycosyltransferase involved in cell wall biosynthesis